MQVFSSLAENFLVFYYQLGLDFKHKASLINQIEKINFFKRGGESSYNYNKALNIFSDNPELPCLTELQLLI